MKLTREECDDAVSRKAVKELAYSQIRSMYCGVALKEQRETMLRIADNVISLLAPATMTQPESFEWCTDCKEYDQEKHCCHRYSKVIRQAFEEMKVVHCIDCQHSEYDSVYSERWCHYNGKAEVVDDYHYCRDGEKKTDDVTCENCDYSEKYVDGLILCRRTKTSHRVSATSTCGKGKREVKDAEAKV